MTDKFATYREGLSDPADNHFPITPDDGLELITVPRGIYVGVTGDISITDKEGVVAVYKNVPQGSVLPFRGVRVNSTGTTATDLIGMY